ncbi:hypothetical protein Q7P37_010599 [Cladosporium fusiforme]
MAAVPPTPSTLRSWEEAFDHPLPVVRKLESQLRTQISENQNRLRSLVGTSYRDLLGTAERIIEMDGQMQSVEGNLAGIGRRCDYRVVERGRENLGRLRNAGRQQEEQKLEVAARVKVLKGALETVGRIIRKGGNTLGAAKVLVLARLLHNSISENDSPPAVLAELKKKLTGMRKRLLSYIERSLAQTTGDRIALSNTLCAYAMITSSVPKDVLRHFLQVRYEQLESKAETPNEHNILSMLDLYGKTLTDTRDLFPRRLADALGQLSKAPLLQDEHVTSNEDLNLDVYRQWIPEDIRGFTPWVRNDQLTSSETNDGLRSWAKQAQVAFVQTLEECLQAQQSAQVVLSVRRNVLSKFLSVSSNLRSEGFTQSINDLRNVFLCRLGELAVHSAELSNFALQSLDDLESLSNPTQQASPWSLATQALDMKGGALSFRTAILDHRHGRTEPIRREHDALDRWTAQLNSHWEFVADMRSAKWDDDLDFDLEDLDYEGDESLQEALSRNDAIQLESKLREATTEAFKRAYGKVEAATGTETQHAAFFVRVLRELDQRRRALADRISAPGDVNPFDHKTMVSSLHTALAEQACQQPLAEFKSALHQQTFIAVSLWDGTPALPMHPSPVTFRFLTALQARMASTGEDVWSAAAVKAVHDHVCKGLSEALTSFPASNPDDTGEKEVAGDEDRSSKDKVLRVQRAFDTLCLSSAFGSTLKENAATLCEVAGLDEAARQRMEKSASDYWKRTSLLFGLLAH